MTVDIPLAAAAGQSGLVAMTTATAPVSMTTAAGRTYYVSATGSDDAAGTSPVTAWRTLARAGQHHYAAGDRLLLAGGESFHGELSFRGSGSGTARAPIVISTYGTGRATIDVTDPSESGVLVENAGGYDITNLDIVGPGRITSTKPGLLLYSTVSRQQSDLRVADVAVTSFNQGIVIGVVGRKAGFRDIQLTSVSTTNNADAGIETFGDHAGSITDLRISDSLASDNPGVPGKTSSTGNGIVLGAVSDTVVSYSVAARNGASDVASLQNGSTNGPAGMWAYDSTGVTFSDNEAYDNSTGNHVDGDGFDLDQSVTNSVLEDNYSYGNAGAGFLLDGTAAHQNRGNTVRYNISVYNGWDNNYAGLEIIGSVSGADLYNNTVYASPFPASPSRPAAVRVSGAGVSAAFRNNLLDSSGGLALVEAFGNTGSLSFQGNDYWSSNGPMNILWDKATYNGLQAWRAATAQESVGGRPVGLQVDPEVVNPNGSQIVDQATQLTAMTALKLKTGSPLVAAGLNLAGAPFDTPGGSTDFFGTRIASHGPYAVGADQIPAPAHRRILTRALLVAACDVAILSAGASAVLGLRRRQAL